MLVRIFVCVLSCAILGCGLVSSGKPNITEPHQVSQATNTLTFSTDTFAETFTTDDGSFTTEIILTLDNDEFNFTNDKLILYDQYKIFPLPFGIEPNLEKIDSKKAKLTLSGNALFHDPTNSSKVSFQLLSSSVKSTKLPANAEKELKIDYVDNPAITAVTLSYGTKTFTEEDRNVPTVVSVMISGDTFVNKPVFSAGTDYALSGTPLPSGLSMKVERLSATELKISIQGLATEHAKSNSVTDIQFTLAAQAFQSAMVPSNGSNKATFAINFVDTPFEESILIYEAGGDYDGNLVDRASVDDNCYATQPGNLTQTNFRALISFGGMDRMVTMPARFGFRSDITIRSVANKIISDSWVKMFDGSIDQSLVDAEVFQTAGEQWWSGSTVAGSVDAKTCNAWTSNSASILGQTGTSENSDSRWINSGTAGGNCNELRKILCVAF